MAEAPLDQADSVLVHRTGVVAWLTANGFRWPVWLMLILLLGTSLRFHGLGWDQPAGAEHPLQMHPDERALSFVADRTDWPDTLGGYFDTAHSPLNPYNTPGTNSYVYGTFPLFLVKGIATLAGDDPAGPDNSYNTDVEWGRAVTAAVDVGTIALVFGIGFYLFGSKAGLLGALFYALAVLPTQLAHFWTMDPYVTFFGAATLLVSAVTVRADRWWARGGLTLLLGLAIGLGLASKVTAWPLALGPVVATAIRIALRDLPGLGLRFRGERRAPGGYWTIDIAMLCLTAALAMLVFRVAQPYAFEGPHLWDMGISARWRSDIQGEIDRQNGDINFPPFVQFAGRAALLWPLRNMVIFGLGPGLGLAAWGAVAAAATLTFKRREVSYLLPLVVLSAIFAFQGPRFVAWMRYFVPMYPELCILAGWGLVALLGWSKRWHGGLHHVPSRLRPGPRTARGAAIAAAAVVIGTTVFWATAFQNVYSTEHTRLQASAWIYQNVPPGSTITAEAWDDSLPYAMPGKVNRYTVVETQPYETDSPDKIRKLVYGGPSPNQSVGLNGADYVAISSNRVRYSVRQLEREYPATIRYYQLLDSGELGFQLVAHFQVRPSFLGIGIDDSGAEESFTVYDHPEVRIYRKTQSWDAGRALALLNKAHPERAMDLLPRQGGTNGLQFTAEQARVQQSGGTFTDIFDAHGWASSIPWLWWLLWLEVAAFATLPWATWLLRSLPDRGYGLSKIFGITSIALPTWLAVAWGAAQFSASLVWIIYAAVVLIGLGLGLLRRRALLTEAREHWPSWLALEGAFLVAFFAFLALRYWNPDLWYHPQGGEKPMELAFLTAVTRSTTMPPYDPWFAGGTMNYYYMGWFFLSVPIRALRLLPEIAFNLGVPTFAALAAVVATSTVHNLVALSARAGLTLGHPRQYRRPAIIAGLFGAILFVGIGNLDGAHQLVERLQAVNTWQAFQGTPVLGGATGIVGGLSNWLFHGVTLPPFDWWRSSRVHIGTIDITEFPYWTFLFADLHPHLMGLPFFGLVIALGVAYVVTSADGANRQSWALAASLGLALGLVRTVHTWDFPAAALIVGASIVLGQLVAPGRWDRRFWSGLAHMAVAFGTAIAAFAPYTRHFEVFNSGLVRAPETTLPHQYLAHFGVFICFALAFLAVRHHEELLARGGAGSNPVLAMTTGRIELAALLMFTVGLAFFTWRVGVTVVALSVLAELFLVNLLWLDLRAKERDLARLLATALFALGFAVAAGVDVVTVKNDIERMNTVFKFSLEAWQLFALASAFGAWYAGRYLWNVDGFRARPRPRRTLAAAAGLAAASVLLFGTSIYVFSGTPRRENARFAALPRGLNGLNYLETASFTEDRGTPSPSDDVTIRLADDEPLIRWLRENVQGSPVIVEAVGPLYHWTGRISVNTGLPAVIGWDWHETQQRWDYSGLVAQRRVDTQRFFTDMGSAEAAQYLRRYDVSYIVVGTEERVLGTPEGLAKFALMPSLQEVFRSGPYVIYHVDQGSLPP